MSEKQASSEIAHLEERDENGGLLRAQKAVIEMICTKCNSVIQKGETYYRTKKGPHHGSCPHVAVAVSNFTGEKVVFRDDKHGASSEIAQSRERFEKYAEKRELDLTPNTTVFADELPYADIVTQDHYDCWQAAERDTRERVAQQLTEIQPIPELIPADPDEGHTYKVGFFDALRSGAERIRGKE